MSALGSPGPSRAIHSLSPLSNQSNVKSGDCPMFSEAGPQRDLVKSRKGRGSG